MLVIWLTPEVMWLQPTLSDIMALTLLLSNASHKRRINDQDTWRKNINSSEHVFEQQSPHRQAGGGGGLSSNELRGMAASVISFGGSHQRWIFEILIIIYFYPITLGQTWSINWSINEILAGLQGFNPEFALVASIRVSFLITNHSTRWQQDIVMAQTY